MNCQWSEQVAMLIDGEPVTAELSAHLAACEECRELLAELKADQVLLQEPPEVPAGVVAARVRRQLAIRRWRWLSAAGAVAAAVLFAVIMLRPQPPQTIAIAPPVAPTVEPVPAAAPTPVAHVRKVVKSRRHAAPVSSGDLLRRLEAALEPTPSAPASAHTPVLVTAQTADPDVVIVLVPDSKGDSL